MSAKFGLDEYAHLTSPIHQWETRTKIVGLLLLIFAFASITDWRLLPAIVIIAAVVYATSNIPFVFLRKRLIVPGYFILSIVLFLPFIAGETVVAEFGRIQLHQEGIISSALIATRLLCIFTLTVVLFGSNTFLNLIKGMRGLGMPLILTDMVLLTYRYIFEIGAYFSQVLTAARLRGFQPSKASMQTFRTAANLIGNVLVRSYEQSDRVYKAMILRGYGVGNVAQHTFQTERTDYVKLALCAIAAVALVATQLII